MHFFVDKPFSMSYTINIVKREKGNSMTKFVKEKTFDILEGVNTMKRAMREDYAAWSDRPNDSEDARNIALKMYNEYCTDLTESYGSKYIKIYKKNGGVLAFIVNVTSDKKFALGDILKPAGWNAPARNFARGNVLDGGYEIRWTGA